MLSGTVEESHIDEMPILRAVLVISARPEERSFVRTNAVAKSAPDGYAMVIGTTADAINQTLYVSPPICLSSGQCRCLARG